MRGRLLGSWPRIDIRLVVEITPRACEEVHEDAKAGPGRKSDVLI
jgi:hypothetical protein